MSLESERRAIGSNNEAARRGIGQRMINDRAAIKAGISAARASTFKADLNALETAPRKQVTLTKRDAKGTRAATVGTGSYKAPATTGTTGVGIASPLTEDSYATREFHPAQTLWTSDGYFAWEVKAPKKIVQTDANGAEVVQQFAAQP